MTWFLGFLAFGVVGTWLARRYALAHALLDEPGERRSHSVATPRGGGIAIVAAVLTALAVAALQARLPLDLAFSFGAGLLAVALVGLADDHRPLSPWLRLAIHVLAAAGLAAAWLHAGGSACMAGVVFVGCVYLTNAWNFMDGINGIATSQAAIVALSLSGAAGPGGWGLVATALAASCVGFLPFNFPRARIFLGDVGSGTIGYAIAALGVLALGRGSQAFWHAVSILLSAFVIDTGLTLLRRIVRGERWWTAHAQHAYQVCARRWGHARVTISYGVWTGAAALISRQTSTSSVELTVLVAVAWYTSGALLWLWLQHRYGEQSRMDPNQGQDGGRRHE